MTSSAKERFSIPQRMAMDYMGGRTDIDAHFDAIIRKKAAALPGGLDNTVGVAAVAKTNEKAR